jgi:alpha-methylacyl-CoA racemase
VIRVDRTPTEGAKADASRDYLARGKRSVAINMKDARGVETLLKLIENADVLIEPFRPGVMEKLGAGPDIALARNPKLIYARLTGWGQEGPYAAMAGHDINYIAITGALSCIGRKGEKPIPPVNLLGDFAGGGMLCALGIAMALFERTRSGEGQVIDAAMVDGVSHLASFLFGFRHAGIFTDERGTNMLDTGAPFYDTYETRDGNYMSVGSIEPQFYAALLVGLGLADEKLPHQFDTARWSETAARFTEIFKTKTRQEWVEVFDGTDACVAPVVTMPEAFKHPHNVERGTFVPAVNGDLAPQAAPRLSRTPGAAGASAPLPGENSDEVMKELGLSADEISKLKSDGVLG